MITISNEAKKEIHSSIADKGENPCVRIYVVGYG